MDSRCVGDRCGRMMICDRWALDGRCVDGAVDRRSAVVGRRSAVVGARVGWAGVWRARTRIVMRVLQVVIGGWCGYI